MRVAVLDVDIAVYQVSMSCERETRLEVVQETMDLYLKGWLSTVNASKYLGYITDSNANFRVARAETWTYKGHRKKDKPKWLPAMREYVQEKWECQLVVGIEADDALTIAAEALKAQGLEPVIVTHDKDLLQYPGLHFNPNKSDAVFEVSPEQAHYNLWHQVITGDRTDNIPGVSHAITETTMGERNRAISNRTDLTPKEKVKLQIKYPNQELYGPATAKKYLANVEPEDYAVKVWELYVDKYEDMEDSGSEGYGDLRFWETFDLIYMLLESPEGVEVLTDIKDPPPDSRVQFLDF